MNFGGISCIPCSLMKLNKYHYHDKYNNFSTVHLQECEGIDISLGECQ